MSLFILIIAVMLLGDLLCWRQSDRLVRTLRRAGIYRACVAVFMGAQLGCLMFIIFGRFLRENADELLPRPLVAAVFIWHFIVLPVTIIAVAGSAVARLVATFRPTPPQPSLPADPRPQRALTRRQFLVACAAAAPPLATIVVTGIGLEQLDDFRIRPINVRLPQLPNALDGLTIAHVSDTHIGRFTNGGMLRRIVDATNSLRADLVLFTGDLINHALADLPAGIDMLRRMEGRCGVYLCEGNHDLFESRWGFEQGVRASGVPLLINESAIARVRGCDVQLMGLRWARGEQAITQSVRVLVGQLRRGAFPILLAHHPHAFDSAADARIPLTLSGHSHGGQLMLSPSVGFGPLMFRYWSGLYEKGDSRLVVSNGVGNWFPLRVRAPAEIVHITLHRA